MSNRVRRAASLASTADATSPDSLELPREAVRSPRLSAWWLLLAAFFLVWNLGYSPFWTPDEGRYASASLEMSGLLTTPTAGGNNWVVPHFDTIPRLNKPPMIYWLSALCYRAIGVSEITARLAPALAALGVLLVVWQVGMRMFGREAGIMAGLAWATTTLPFALGRTCNTDMLLTLALTLATGGVYLAIEGRFKREGKGSGEVGGHEGNASAEDLSADRVPSVPWGAASLVAGAGFGLALLAKGPVGIALPLLIGFVYLCVARRWRHVPWLGFVGALVLGVAVGAPWYLAVERQQPGFTKNFIFSENLGRLSGKDAFHKPSPFYYYLPVILAGLLPWTTWFFAALLLGGREIKASLAREESPLLAQGEKHDPEVVAHARRGRIFAWLWAGLIVAFFSVSKTKLVSYVLPAFPAFALLLGATWQSLRHEHASRARAWAFSGTIALLGAAAIGIIGFALSGVVLAHGEAWSVVWQPLIVLVLGIVMLTLLLRRRDWFTIGLTQFLIAGAFCATLLPLAQRINAHKEPGAVIEWAAPHIPTEGRLIVLDTFEPAAIFYLRRPVTFVNFKNTSGLNENALHSSPLFPYVKPNQTPLYLTSLLKDARPTWVYVSWRSPGLPFTAQFPYHVWGYSDDGVLLANRPLEFVRPYNAMLSKTRKKLEAEGRFPTLKVKPSLAPGAIS